MQCQENFVLAQLSIPHSPVIYFSHSPSLSLLLQNSLLGHLCILILSFPIQTPKKKTKLRNVAISCKGLSDSQTLFPFIFLGYAVNYLYHLWNSWDTNQSSFGDCLLELCEEILSSYVFLHDILDFALTHGQEKSSRKRKEKRFECDV